MRYRAGYSPAMVIPVYGEEEEFPVQLLLREREREQPPSGLRQQGTSKLFFFCCPLDGSRCVEIAPPNAASSEQIFGSNKTAHPDSCAVVENVSKAERTRG